MDGWVGELGRCLIDGWSELEGLTSAARGWWMTLVDDERTSLVSHATTARCTHALAPLPSPPLGVCCCWLSPVPAC